VCFAHKWLFLCASGHLTNARVEKMRSIFEVALVGVVECGKPLFSTENNRNLAKWSQNGANFIGFLFSFGYNILKQRN
jgi:hypothetical protein